MEKNKNIENFLKHVSKEASGWLEKAKWRQENEDWLDISFSIAVRIGSTLVDNKKANVYPKTQLELAELMGCSPQYVNKLLKGEERLQIDTICKIGSLLGIKLIEVPKIESKQTLQYSNQTLSEEIIKSLSEPINTSVPYSEKEIIVVAGDGNYALAA